MPYPAPYQDILLRDMMRAQQISQRQRAGFLRTGFRV